MYSEVLLGLAVIGDEREVAEQRRGDRRDQVPQQPHLAAQGRRVSGWQRMRITSTARSLDHDGPATQAVRQRSALRNTAK